jgi:putative FmdB family regulatory protein
VPTYDYQCRSCGHVTEVIHSMLEDGPTECERCGGELRRVIYPTGIIFKGPGFYSTDSRSGSSKTIAGSTPSSPATPSSTESSESGASATTPTADTKAAAAD